jgi:hypothetical protein
MTLSTYSGGPGPRVHALIIGIGGYDHLIGGNSKTLPNVIDYGYLTQLSSPPRSAIAIADTLRDLSDDFRVPLGTVDLLISVSPQDPDPSGKGEKYDAATSSVIRKAFDAWWARCDSDPDNVAILYIGGHGVEGRRHVVLASDFGSSESQPWLDAFDIETTCKAFASNRAETQVLLIDTCREITPAMAESPDAVPLPLRNVGLHQTNHCRYSLRVFSTQRSSQAYGPRFAPSHFAAALIIGLRGGAASKNDGKWWITTGKMAERMSLLMEVAGADRVRQQPDTAASESCRLLEMRGIPKAKLKLSCEPEEAALEALLEYHKHGLPSLRRPEPSVEPWTIEVEPGHCITSAIFTGSRFQSMHRELWVEPPLTRERISVI